MKYYFPIHLDGGNRGCEAIAKGTANLLDKKKEDLVSLCSDVDLDTKFGIDKFVTLQRMPKWTFLDKVKRELYYHFIDDIEKRKNYNYHHRYASFLNLIGKDDMLLSTGGDMMCYDNNEVLFTADYVHNRGIKTVLWGCSMGKDNLTIEKEKTLRNFDLIYARESLSYDFLKGIGLKNVVCFPDPAFILSPEVVQLPKAFNRGNVIGVNISNYVISGYDLTTPFALHIIELIDYILNNTDLQILLIPHVTWPGQDDRVIANRLYSEYQESDRISVLNIDNLNYCQIRYVISKCKYFIGARTHAVISAYSTCVPTIALGYSIKSKGIAKDLGIDEKFVIDNNCSNTSILGSFVDLVDFEKQYRQQLGLIIPSYIEKTKGIKGYLNKSTL